MNQKHVMIDIETLGQNSNSVITQLSAVIFDIETGELGSTFNEFIYPPSAIEAGLKMEFQTMLWWLEQSDAAREHLIKGFSNSSGLTSTLKKFSTWFHEYCTHHSIIWGRGPRFDFGLLTDAYNAISIPIPWNFRNEMCVRTMEYLRPEVKKSIQPVDNVGHGSEGGGMHNGLIDAIYQAKYVSAIFKDLNNKKDAI